jgi:hypothetical protein
MKLTKQQLQKVIQEELAAMQQEGELEEGFLDRLFGKDKRSTEFVSGQEVKDVVNNVINSISELVRVSSRQGDMGLADKAAELKRMAMSLPVQEVPAGKDLPPSDFKTGTKFSSAARPVRGLKEAE